jgi:glutamyl-tRNA synthetase
MNKKVRVRFAPSPTGGLHLGGVRTALYNYLFAKNQGGDFILRIEDTDQSRYVPGAEEYIFNCLEWAGLMPDESPKHGGNYGPYRQSERKESYRKYAEQLVKDGHAYYAFDTPEDLEKMRHDFKTEQNPSPQYDQNIRIKMRNSLTLPADEVKNLLDSNTRHVIRIKMPEHETVSFTDMIRGEVSFDTSVVDDKVLLKADGMPTYHLAVVVDDYLMKITHAFRGEEWLPSAPVHVLLWKYLFGINKMPQWAHLPLILGPNGKLSKRDGSKYGFPVFAMNWTDPKTNELIKGFREEGFSPAAFINFLALLGWNDGSEQEIFSKAELIEKFSMDRVHKSGAKFDYEKAKWFRDEWKKRNPINVPPEENVPLDWFSQADVPTQQLGRIANYAASYIAPQLHDDSTYLISNILNEFQERGIPIKDRSYFLKVFTLLKERCASPTDFYNQGWFFFNPPEKGDVDAVKPKWNDAKKEFFEEYQNRLSGIGNWELNELENSFMNLATEKNIKPGELQLPFRIMLVGGKFGPPVFNIAEILGKDETISRIKKVLAVFS